MNILEQREDCQNIIARCQRIIDRIDEWQNSNKTEKEIEVNQTSKYKCDIFGDNEFVYNTQKPEVVAFVEGYKAWLKDNNAH